MKTAQAAVLGGVDAAFGHVIAWLRAYDLARLAVITINDRLDVSRARAANEQDTPVHTHEIEPRVMASSPSAT
jgi:hypothetical protein